MPMRRPAAEIASASAIVGVPAGSMRSCGLDAISRFLIWPCSPAINASEISSVATPTASPSIEIDDRNAVCRCLRADQR